MIKKKDREVFFLERWLSNETGLHRKETERTSEEKAMIRTTMKIDGMMCGMCEAHVYDAIRKAVPTARKVAASKNKKEASFLTDEAVDTDSLKAAIDATGYTCLGVESAPCEKKGLFGWK